MQPQFKNVAVVFTALFLLTTLLAYWAIKFGFKHNELLPEEESHFAWKLLANTDEEVGGSSSVIINDSSFALDFSFFTTEGTDYPYIAVSTEFVDKQLANKLVDLSNYDTLGFAVKCDPENVLAVAFLTTESENLPLHNILTRRIPTSYFKCKDDWTEVTVDLKRLQIPHWWMKLNKVDLSDQAYDLSRVYSIHFTNSEQSPNDTPSNVKISRLTLSGRDWNYIYAFAIFSVISWILFSVWFVKQLIEGITDKIHRKKAMVAYKQLSIEPKRDRDKSQVLHYLANEYADPELNLETASNTIGINRNKINDILREELGMTFNTYLNKLRLTEAARLLTEKEDANVAEIASTVGYNNSSYFTKLFKKEFGHSPSSFKNINSK